MVKALQSSSSSSRQQRNSSGLSTVFILLLNSVVLLLVHQFLHTFDPSWHHQQQPNKENISFYIPQSDNNNNNHHHHPYGVQIPRGIAKPLPSIRIEKDSTQRTIYGGVGDKPHLGGFTKLDPDGISPILWKHMVTHLGIKTLLDVGCGRGISTSWFVIHGLEYVACVEGSHDAVQQSILPNIATTDKNKKKTWEITEHDFSRGPWWPSQTVDVVWCVEFTEHVGRNYMQNYYTAFHKAALIFVTHSNWGGWHHVEVHDDAWWQVKMEAQGFTYSDILTKEMREKVHNEPTVIGPHTHVGAHVWGTLQVFINPLVASLPEHQHLFAQHGCYTNKTTGNECGKKGLGKGVEDLTSLPEEFKPLKITKDMDDQWLKMVTDIANS